MITAKPRAVLHTAGATIVIAALLAWTDPSVAADPAAGRDKARQCVACHGLDGLARMPNVPHIAGDSAQYLRAQLRAFRSGEREDPQMNVMAEGLNDEDIDDLAAWYSTIEISAQLPEIGGDADD